VEEVQKRIEENARLEFELIWSEKILTGKPSGVLTDEISNKINYLKFFIQQSTLYQNEVLRRNVLREAIPDSMIQLLGLDVVISRAPDNYLRALFGAYIASRFVYKYGLESTTNPILYFDFIKNYMTTSPEISSVAPTKVLISGAAGNIAYSLIFAVAQGEIFGPSQAVILHLLDVPEMEGVLKGVAMELQDCAFPLVKEVVITSDLKVAFKDVQLALLVGAQPRGEGMARKELLEKNGKIYLEQGQALEQWAHRNVKVVVVGNPTNTNCLICMNAAPSIPKENFTALTRLDQNRAKIQLAKRIGVDVGKIKNIIVWGNHSATQFPDASHGLVIDYPRQDAVSDIRTLIQDDNWLKGEFINMVQQRGDAVIQCRKSSSAASAAKAIVDHVRNWLIGNGDEIVSMGTISDGSYGIASGIVFSFPVSCKNRTYTIVKNWPLDDYQKKHLKITEAELLEEREMAVKLGLLKSQPADQKKTL